MTIGEIVKKSNPKLWIKLVMIQHVLFLRESERHILNVGISAAKAGEALRKTILLLNQVNHEN